MKFLVVLQVLPLEVELFPEQPRCLGQWSILSKGHLEQLSSQKVVLQEQEMKA